MRLLINLLWLFHGVVVIRRYLDLWRFLMTLFQHQFGGLKYKAQAILCFRGSTLPRMWSQELTLHPIASKLWLSNRFTPLLARTIPDYHTWLTSYDGSSSDTEVRSQDNRCGGLGVSNTARANIVASLRKLSKEYDINKVKYYSWSLDILKTSNGSLNYCLKILLGGSYV